MMAPDRQNRVSQILQADTLGSGFISVLSIQDTDSLGFPGQPMASLSAA